MVPGSAWRAIARVADDITGLDNFVRFADDVGSGLPIREADEVSRDVSVPKPSFGDSEYTEYMEYISRFNDPQQFIDDFVSQLEDRPPVVRPIYRPPQGVLGQAGAANTVQELIFITDGLNNDVDLFLTIFHEDAHIQLERLAQQGDSLAIDILANPLVEEEWVEFAALSYYEWYTRQFGTDLFQFSP
jgi:hypothetical protein